jgi:CRISPR-associated protein Cas1
MIQTLLNTLYVQTQGAYLHLDHDTLKVEVDNNLKLQVPLHHLGGIAVFGNVLLSPFLIHRCAQDGREISWFSVNGWFQARLSGPISGNVLLRRDQYKSLDLPERTLYLACCFIESKLRNTRLVLQRAVRERGPTLAVKTAIIEQKRALHKLSQANSLDEARGLEGQAASAYFAAFKDLILPEEFTLLTRVKRPPRDPINALLSFLYSLLVVDCVAALEGVGLDPQVGYLHALRPGRPALALDLMEEFRAWWIDRLALALINRRQLSPRHFTRRPGGAVHLNEAGRKEVLVAYQKRKQEKVRQPYFKEPVPIGLLPHVQARMLARYIRGDLDKYPPFVGK